MPLCGHPAKLLERPALHRGAAQTGLPRVQQLPATPIPPAPLPRQRLPHEVARFQLLTHHAQVIRPIPVVVLDDHHALIVADHRQRRQHVPLLRILPRGPRGRRRQHLDRPVIRRRADFRARQAVVHDDPTDPILIRLPRHPPLRQREPFWPPASERHNRQHSTFLNSARWKHPSDVSREQLNTCTPRHSKSFDACANHFAQRWKPGLWFCNPCGCAPCHRALSPFHCWSYPSMMIRFAPIRYARFSAAPPLFMPHASPVSLMPGASRSNGIDVTDGCRHCGWPHTSSPFTVSSNSTMCASYQSWSLEYTMSAHGAMRNVVFTTMAPSTRSRQ